jgi:hypothetical protein
VTSNNLKKSKLNKDGFKKMIINNLNYLKFEEKRNQLTVLVLKFLKIICDIYSQLYFISVTHNYKNCIMTQFLDKFRGRASRVGK